MTNKKTNALEQLKKMLGLDEDVLKQDVNDALLAMLTQQQKQAGRVRFSDAVDAALYAEYRQQAIDKTGVLRPVDLTPLQDDNKPWSAISTAVEESERYRRAQYGSFYHGGLPPKYAYATFNQNGFEETDTREDTVSEIICTVEAKYDYSVDTNFSVPVDPGVRTYDVSVLARGLEKFHRSEEIKSFKDLVFKSWGKVVTKIDTNKSGGYCFEGDKWIHGKSHVEFVRRMNQADGEYIPGISITNVTFFANPDEEAILLSVSYSQQTLVLVLLNREVAERLKNSDQALFYPSDQLRVVFGGVQVPYPFNQYGDYNTPIQYHNRANLEITLQIHPAYGLALIGKGDFLNKTSSVDFPVDSVLKAWSDPRHYMSLAPFADNVFTKVAHILDDAKDEGLLLLAGGKVEPVKIKGKDNHFVVQVMNGSESKPEVAKAVEDFEPDNFPIPYGLTELPKPPGNYRWIGDVSGMLLLVDKKGTRAYFPYEVYDIPALVDNLLKMEAELARKHLTPNAATVELRRQIGLIQKMFEHQSRLLQGIAFNFEALGAGTEFLPSEEDM